MSSSKSLLYYTYAILTNQLTAFEGNNGSYFPVRAHISRG